MQTDDHATDETDTSVAPFADLLFSVTTIIIVVLVALVPALGPGGAMSAEDRAKEKTAIEAAVIAARQPRLLLTTNAVGLTAQDLATGERFSTSLDNLLTDQRLIASLQRHRHEPIAVIVEADGNEAMFELDSLAARHGITSVSLLRRP